MTANGVAGRTARPLLLRVTPQMVVVLLVAAVAWAWTVAEARAMGNMPGTMGLGMGRFVVMWGLMMAAMMLVPAAPFAAMYARTVRERRLPRLLLFASGYVVVWTATGAPAYGLAWLAGEAAAASAEAVGVGFAVVIFAACGIYQLTPLKYACLAHCRSPMGHLMHYANFRGPLRDLRTGLDHGAFCIACCWSLMVLMAAFGIMNLWAMVGLAVVVAAEKLAPRGDWLARGIGVAALGLAVMVVFVPEIAPGLTGEAMAMGAE